MISPGDRPEHSETYMFLLPVKSTLLFDGVFTPLSYIDLEGTRCAFKIAQRFVFKYDRLVHYVIQEDLVVRS